MRTLSGILLLVAFALQLLLGGVFLMASRYEPPAAAKLKAPEQGAAAGRQLALGVVVLCGGMAQLVGAVLAFRRRARRLVLILVAGAALAQGGVQLADGPITVGLISLGLTVFALGGLAVGGRAARREPQTGPNELVDPGRP